MIAIVQRSSQLHPGRATAPRTHIHRPAERGTRQACSGAGVAYMSGCAASIGASGTPLPRLYSAKNATWNRACKAQEQLQGEPITVLSSFWLVMFCGVLQGPTFHAGVVA
jgi:hypothetical protein